MVLSFLGSIRLFVHRSSLVSTWLLLVSIHFHGFPKAFHSLSIGFRQFSQICHFLSWDGLAGFCRLLSAVSVSNRKTSKCLFPYGTFFSNYWWSVMIIFLILNNFKLLHCKCWWLATYWFGTKEDFLSPLKLKNNLKCLMHLIFLYFFHIHIFT